MMAFELELLAQPFLHPLRNKTNLLESTWRVPVDAAWPHLEMMNILEVDLAPNQGMQA